jgi:microcystin degradation protein MlrC
MTRIAIAGFQHESNTFSAIPASWEKFERSGVLEGDAIRQRYAQSQSTLAGFLALGPQAPGVQLEPLVFTRLTPMGALTPQARGNIFDRILDALRRGGPWDGVLLALHGAAVAEDCDDPEGELTAAVRALVGPAVPIGVTLDMHANVSQRMIAQADVTTVYQTNPHIDAREQALRCARLLLDCVAGRIHPCAALAQPPLVVNILNQGTDEAPMSVLLARAADHQRRPGVLSVSVIEGYPYADVPDMGMSFLAITDGRPDLAREIADDLAALAWSQRAALNQGGLSIEQALRAALAGPPGPAVLFDVGDNVGGGSPGDGTHLLHAARRLGIGSVLQALRDADAVRACQAAGPGGLVDVMAGGRQDSRHGAPLRLRGRVTALSDGRYQAKGPTHGGFSHYDDGPSASVVTDEGWGLVLSTLSSGTQSLEQFRHLGLEPADYRIIVAKGVHSPRPTVAPIARSMHWVATPGVTTADLSTFEYHHRRRPMYPFEADACLP